MTFCHTSQMIHTLNNKALCMWIPDLILPMGTTLDFNSNLTWLIGSSQLKLANCPFSIGPPMCSLTYLQYKKLIIKRWI